MPDYRSYCPPGSIREGAISLEAGESHHLVRVNRARQGDPVAAFDGCGNEYDCVLAVAHDKRALLKVVAQRQVPRLPYSLTLAQALPKGKTFDNIVRHATEIGASRIVPVVTERTEVRLDEKRSPKKEEKWRTTALEAAKQCGTPFIPEISPTTGLESLLDAEEAYDLKLVAGLVPEAQSLAGFLPRGIQGTPEAPFRVLWLVGPEGDFTPEEIDAPRTHGFSFVTLGPYVLRCETAALYALSITSYELGRRLINPR